ncbi:CDP-glycerol glycerophosphotransferase family protein, partial [Escherichia coli]
VIFESFSGKQYSCNPRAIYEYMEEHNPEYELLWSVNPKFVAVFEAYGVPYVKRFSISWLFKMGLAKYWISNS